MNTVAEPGLGTAAAPTVGNALPAALRGLSGADVQAVDFGATPPPPVAAGQAEALPVVVVGGGPVGLSLAIDLAQRGAARGQPVVLLDNDHRLSTGSRAICFAKRTLEVWDRLGLGDAAVAKGVGWQIGRVFLQDAPLYQFDLLAQAGAARGHERPAFVNLQQYYAEAYLVARALELPNLSLRWQHEVVAVHAPSTPDAPVRLGVQTPDGRYDIVAEHVVACDGSRSPVRTLAGLDTHGQIFRDRFLIADVRLSEPLFEDGKTERWFWFDPPFHPKQSVLLHRQPDDVWRVDFQLGWDADPEAEKRPEAIAPRIRAMLAAVGKGHLSFTLEWASVYTFACERMDRFVHGRLVFAGDAAHRVSPFGARGANSGVQDADNLGWKLDLVLSAHVRGAAARGLLESYGHEREAAADENILNSTRSTDFITPKSPASRLFRDAVLALAREHPFARGWVNSGRLSLPSTYVDSPLNTPDVPGDEWAGALRPGAPMQDAPLEHPAPSWLLRGLGVGFVLIVCGDALGLDAQALASGTVPVRVWQLAAHGEASTRLDAKPGSAYLIRPDQHLAARWRQPTTAAVQAALARACAEAA
jgi:3-(3-hydroxy-phenyl)propionate hydroxylase